VHDAKEIGPAALRIPPALPRRERIIGEAHTLRIARAGVRGADIQRTRTDIQRTGTRGETHFDVRVARSPHRPQRASRVEPPRALKPRRRRRPPPHDAPGRSYAPAREPVHGAHGCDSQAARRPHRRAHLHRDPGDAADVGPGHLQPDRQRRARIRLLHGRSRTTHQHGTRGGCEPAPVCSSDAAHGV
jgi:hypothetical protein